MRCLLFVTVAFICLQLPQHVRAADSISTTLDTLLPALREQTGVPGLSAAVSVHGNLIWHGESGFADVHGGKPVQQGTVFRLASVSKAVCSVIAANLVEDGIVDIDAHAGDLMPNLPQQYHPLTLRDLMTHTSGLPHYEARDFARGRKSYTSAMAGLEQLGDRDLVSPPGTAYLYSTHGFSLAGAMMEQASGKSFPELFDSTIRITDRQITLALESESKNSDLQTRIYEGRSDGDPQELERENFSYSWCGAGMESTAADLSNFTSSLFGPLGLLGPKSQHLLTQPLLDRNGEIVTTNRWAMTLGWRQSNDLRGEIYIHHSGVTNGARSILAIWPKRGLAVSLLSNAAWTGRMEDTAVAFALASESAGVEKNCVQTTSQSYRGSFREQPLTATIQWQDSAGYCQGRLEGTNLLTEWLSQFNFSSTNGHVLVPLIKNRWGLVTPIGISILSGEPSELSGLLGSGEVALVQSGGSKFE